MEATLTFENAVVVKCPFVSQCQHIAELKRERDQWINRAHALLSMLPDDTACGDIQKAVKDLRADERERLINELDQLAKDMEQRGIESDCVSGVDAAADHLRALGDE